MTLAHPGRRTGIQRILGNYPSAVLLGIQLAGLLIYPFLGDDALGRSAFAVVQQLVLVAAVGAVV